jgi:hypothetical protein
MPAGLPYFAWIDASETTFGPEHLRWDEAVFSFTLAQEEGDPASLTAQVRRPRNVSGDPIGLLGPGRKIWAWFALDCGPALIKFRGRLVGIPTSLFEDLVTLEFVARPFDVVAQKAALADTLRVLPFYDEAVIDPERRKDPDVVLEGYTKIWHYDRETHVVTVSDEISGEDGLVSFDGASDDGKVLYDGLGLNLATGPLARVDVTAEFTWTQQANGTVDLTNYLISHWPGSINGQIPSLNAADWPKHGSSLGDGWEVAESSAQDVFDFSTHTETRTGSITLEGTDDEGDSRITWSTSTTQVKSSGALISFGEIVTNDSYNTTLDADQTGAASASRSRSSTFAVVGVQSIVATLVAGYKAERQCTERVSFSLFADVQPILTDPEDGEALRIENIRSVNLSGEESVGEEGTEIIPAIIDPRRRSYIATERGNQSIEHLIALARTNLMKRARAVEITFAPKLARMAEITLRKNVFLAEPRVGEALGKIIGYSIALDGADGRVNCEIRIGCTIGYGGIVTAIEGTPTYCSVDYVGADYQQFLDRTILVDAFTDSSVGYQPPDASPNDDGIDFLSALRAEDVIDTDLVVEHGPDPTQDVPEDMGAPANTTSDQASQAIQARSEFIKQQILPQYETRAKFKLKSMTREFATEYELQVTDLKIPAGYDLEAA